MLMVGLVLLWVMTMQPTLSFMNLISTSKWTNQVVLKKLVSMELRGNNENNRIFN